MSGPRKPVAIIMGSQSDWPTMKRAAETLEALDVGYAAKIVSAAAQVRPLRFRPTVWSPSPRARARRVFR